MRTFSRQVHFDHKYPVKPGELYDSSTSYQNLCHILTTAQKILGCAENYVLTDGEIGLLLEKGVKKQNQKEYVTLLNEYTGIENELEKVVEELVSISNKYYYFLKEMDSWRKVPAESLNCIDDEKSRNWYIKQWETFVHGKPIEDTENDSVDNLSTVIYHESQLNEIFEQIYQKCN